MLGFVNSCYQLGSIFAVPIAPWVAHRYGRRWSIMIGSLIMVVGAILQGFSQHGEYLLIANGALRWIELQVTDIYLQSACTSFPVCCSVSVSSSVLSPVLL